MQHLAVCIERIEQNRLKLNQDKTQLIWIGTRQQLAKVGAIELTLPSVGVSFSTTVSDLVFIIDTQLNVFHRFSARVTFNCGRYVMCDVH